MPEETMSRERTCEQTPAPPPRRHFLLLFTGQTSLKLPRFLKPGFRHCLVLIEGRDGWRLINPLAEELLTRKVAPMPVEDLCDFYRQQGFTVVTGTTSGVKIRRTAGNCVKAAKRLIGIRAWHVQTPHQLYTYVRKTGKENS